MKSLQCPEHWLAARVIAHIFALFLGAIAPRASAQAPTPFVCPLDQFANPEKCQRLAERQEKREARERKVQEEERYLREHPFRIALATQFDLFMLGLGDSYVAGFWGFAAGPSLVFEFAGPTLRADLLGRFGHGHISNWNIDSGGPISASAGYLGGVEAQLSLLFRIRSVFIGPTFSLGYFHLRAQTLQERDFDDTIDNDSYTVAVPGDSAFLAAGLIGGWELTPGGQVGINLHITPGVWNDFAHLYLNLALNLSVKLWD